MKRAFTASLIALYAAALPSCDSGRVDRLEKQNRELAAQLHRQEAAQVYELEAKCDEEAQTYYDRHWKQSAGYYEHHFNKVLNKCFFVVVHTYTYGKPLDFDWFKTVIDLHDTDNAPFAQYVEVMGTSNGRTIGNHCYIRGASADEQASCREYADFEKLLKGYMSN